MRVSHSVLCALNVLAVCLSLFSDVARAENASTIDLGYAKYQGVFNTTTNITGFLGIRYAAPPTRDLRWRAPQAPLNDTSGQVIQANANPPECLQAPTGQAPTNPLRPNQLQSRQTGSNPAPSDDCLFLNVYLPGDTIPESLPVVVWIHGGGYIFGGIASQDGSDLVVESQHGVVSVVIQYRLGVFGFLPGSAVKANGTLNAGLLDQQFALQWVQQHISQFGGDPTRVTIWGESAGAGSVLQQVIANDGATDPPLFRSAITSSTFLPSQYQFDDIIPELLYSEVLSRTNCANATDTLACLRAADVNLVQQANMAINIAGFFGTFVFVPVIDGDFITQRPTLALAQGKVNGEALLAITNADEGQIFVNQTAPITQNTTEYIRQLFPLLGDDDIRQAAELYALTGLPAVNQSNMVQAESIFVCPSYYILDAFNGSTAFKGEFAVPPALHGMDVNFYFPTGHPPSVNNTVLTATFAESFLSFVISQDPNNKISSESILPSWSMFQEGDTEMVFNVTADGQAVVNTTTTDPDLLDRCRFWLSVGNSTGQ